MQMQRSDATRRAGVRRPQPLPAPAPSRERSPAVAPAPQMLARLQRSAGNAAVSALVARAAGGRVATPTLMRAVFPRSAVAEDKRAALTAIAGGGASIDTSGLSRVKRTELVALLETDAGFGAATLAALRRELGPDPRSRPIINGTVRPGTGRPGDRSGALNAAVAAALPPGFARQAWFHDEQEAIDYSMGIAEGMGVWNGEWVNLAGLGTIVLGEEHNDIREAFVTALNITHRLREGESERGLHGVDAASIPAPAVNARVNSRYEGDDARALENYWLRAGQSIAAYAPKAIAALREFAGSAELGADMGAWIVPDAVDPSLVELVRTLLGVVVPAVPEQPGVGRDVVVALADARVRASRCEELGFLAMADLAARKLAPGGGRDADAAYAAWVDDLATRPEQAGQLLGAVQSLAAAIERLGYAQFKAISSSDELALDASRVAAAPADDVFAVWSPRRDVAMLANLREAMTKDPPPMFVTMGREHAKRREPELEAMLRGRGRLLIGDLAAVAALGKAPRRAPPVAVPA
jgi:hypothetical protein